MGTRRFLRCATSIAAGYALLSACSSSQMSPHPLFVTPTERAAYRVSRSPTQATTSSQDLLYIAASPNWPNGTVYVYTYPNGQPTGTLTGFFETFGECTDAAGDIFIVAYANASFNSSTIYEFAHGGTSPIAELGDPNVAFGCAVDPTTGNLAAAGDGVAIFQHASGSPKIYSYAYGFHYCGYDNQGNLYLSATNVSYAGRANLVRLAKGSANFEQIMLNKKLYASSRLWPSVQWDGKHVTVTSNPTVGHGAPILLYRLAIAGTNAKVVGTTTLSSRKNQYSGQTWIQGKTVVGAGNIKRGYEDAFLWAYPKGGGAVRAIKKIGDIRYPEVSGVAVSPGKSR